MIHVRRCFRKQQKLKNTSKQHRAKRGFGRFLLIEIEIDEYPSDPKKFPVVDRSREKKRPGRDTPEIPDRIPLVPEIIIPPKEPVQIQF